jgi:hypothetical protein
MRLDSLRGASLPAPVHGRDDGRDADCTGSACATGCWVETATWPCACQLKARAQISMPLHLLVSDMVTFVRSLSIILEGQSIAEKQASEKELLENILDLEYHLLFPGRVTLN